MEKRNESSSERDNKAMIIDLDDLEIVEAEETAGWGDTDVKSLACSTIMCG